MFVLIPLIHRRQQIHRHNQNERSACLLVRGENDFMCVCARCSIEIFIDFDGTYYGYNYSYFIPTVAVSFSLLSHFGSHACIYQYKKLERQKKIVEDSTENSIMIV